MDRKELEQTILRYLGKHYSGTLSTVREDGTPQASGITFVNDGLVLYFGMDPESQKKRNVDRNPNVGMAIFKDYHRFDKTRAVHLAGRCEVTTDEAELATVALRFTEKFPKLAEYTGMFEWVERVGPVPMYKITPKVIAYMDYPRFGFNRAEILDLS